MTIEPITTPVKGLETLIKQAGPEPQEYAYWKNQILHLYTLWQKGNLDHNAIEDIRQKLGAVLSQETLLGWNFSKPYGYAGDFQVIDMIYRYKTSSNPSFFRWDQFFNSFSAAQAVRNRKTYFKNLLLRKTLQSNRTLHVLNLASGPARDLLEFFQENPDADIHITCVELDPRAIAYAKNLLGGFKDRVTFVERNVFKYHTSDSFDLIWSAGLFDYFTDDVFVRLIRRFHNNMLAPQGELIVGNFHPRNPSRPVMELLGDWFLHHRTEAHLEQLAREAVPDVGPITIDQEPEGINLFLRMPK
jgi:SAM-dependent methyltransferase